MERHTLLKYCNRKRLPKSCKHGPNIRESLKKSILTFCNQQDSNNLKSKYLSISMERNKCLAFPVVTKLCLRHLVRLFRIFCNCFNLSRLQAPLQCTKKMVDLPMLYNANLLKPVREYVAGMCWIYKCLLPAMKLVWTKLLLSFVQIWCKLVIGSMSLSSFIREFPTQDQNYLW